MRTKRGRPVALGSEAKSPMVDVSAALVAGRYRLVRRIATGGMGEIFLAVHEGPQGFQKLVALKRILSKVAAEQTSIQHFLDEAQLASRLTHRSIAQVFDFGEDQDGYFVAMEFVQGGTVAALLRRLSDRGQRLAPALAFDIAAQVAEALGYAWEAKGPDGAPLRVVHRDISPQNVMLSIGGDVKVIDFGVAKSNQQHHATLAGSIKGKLAYMSPEQNRGEALDTRSDIFSLGIVLCEMLTGVHPFARGDMLKLVAAVREDPPVLPSSADAALALADAGILRMLAKDPRERFGDCHEVSEALQALRGQVPAPPVRLGALVSEIFEGEVEEAPASELSKEPAAKTRMWHRTVTLVKGATVTRASREDDSPDLGSTPTIAAKGAPPRGRHRRWAIAAAAGALFLFVSGALLARWMAVPGPRPGPKEPRPPALSELGAARPTPAPPAPPAASPSPGPELQTRPGAQDPRAAPAPRAMEAAVEVLPRAEPPAAGHEPAAGAQRKAPSVPREQKKRPEPAAANEPSRHVPPARRFTYRIIAGSPSGRSEFPLEALKGTLKLAEQSGVAVYLDYSIAEGRVSTKIRCEPWAIAAVDGISVGKTPVPISLGGQPVEVDLRRPGVLPIEMSLSAER